MTLGLNTDDLLKSKEIMADIKTDLLVDIKNACQKYIDLKTLLDKREIDRFYKLEGTVSTAW